MVKDNKLTNLKKFNKLIEKLLEYKKDFIELSIFSYKDQGIILHKRGFSNNRGGIPSVKSIKRYRDLLHINEDGNMKNNIDY